MKKSYIFASVTVLIWATQAPVANLLLTDIPSFETLAISSAFAFVFLLIVNIISGSIKLMKTYRFTDYLIMAGLGFVGLFMYSALYYFGINQLSSQEACILNYLWPIMIVLFASIVLKEKLTVRKIIAMLLSFTGIAVISLGNTDAGNGSRILGIAACVGAAVCYGLFSVLNKKRGYNQSVTMMIIWLTTAICSFVSGLFVESFKPIEELQWLGMIWLGVVINAVAYLLWAIALKGAKDSAKIANLAYLVPFLSIVISAVVLQEQITVNALLALLLIVGGILLQSINIKRRS